MRCNAHSRSKPSYTWITCIVITAILTLVYTTYLLAFVFNGSFGGRRTTTSIDTAFSALVLFPAATWIYAMTVVSYWRTALTDPGRVPREWSLTDAQIKRIQDGHYGQRLHDELRHMNRPHANNNDDDNSGHIVIIDGSDDGDVEEGGGVCASAAHGIGRANTSASASTLLQQRNTSAQHNGNCEVGNDCDESTGELTRDGRIRTCHICKLRKPDRTHHCSQCGRCVLKMDHHCIWVNNCVGFHNYKFFFLFLLYMVIGSAFFCITVSASFFRILKFGEISPGYVPSFSETILLITFLVAFVFGFSLMFFMGFHFRLILFNNTTLEYMEKRTKFRKLEGTPNPYDIGIMANLRSVFGNRWYYWLLPVSHISSNDGTRFKRRSHMLGLRRTSASRSSVTSPNGVYGETEEDDYFDDDDDSTLTRSRNSFGGTIHTPFLP